MEIQTRQVEPDVSVIELTGPVGREGQRIQPLIEELLAQNQKKFIFDFTNVDYIDSAGLGNMISCFSKITQAGGGLRVAGANSKVRHVFKLTGLNDVFPSYETLAAACEDFTPSAPPGG